MVRNLFRYNLLKSIYYSIKWEGSVRIGRNVRISNRGNIKLPPHKTIRIQDRVRIEIRENGFLEFKGQAYLGEETRFLVGKGGRMIIGDNFSCTGYSDFDAIKSIEIGNSCTFSVNLQIMDTDHHKILDDKGVIINTPASISIGNNVWIGCTTTILKGTIIPDNVIIGANSLITKGNIVKSNYIYCGNPIKEVKPFKKWEP